MRSPSAVQAGGKAGVRFIGLRTVCGSSGPRSMPTATATTNKPLALSARISRLAIEAQWAADELLAHEINDAEAERYLAAPAALLESVLATLLSALYRAEQLDQSRHDEDLAIYREIARAHRVPAD
jgi:hypothetical protein